MSIAEQTLYSRLAADATVSGTSGGRITPAPLPDNSTLPAITYQRVFSSSVNGLDGYLGLTFARFQVDAWSRSPGQVYTLASGIVSALTETHTDTRLLNELTTYEPDSRLHRVIVEVEFPYSDR